MRSSLVRLATLLFVLLSTCSATVALGASCVPPPSGLVAWWPAEGDARDVIGGHDGTALGDTHYGPGLVRSSFVFDGEGDFVLVPFAEEFDFSPEGEFTIAMWAMTTLDDAWYQALLVKAPGDVTWDWGLQINAEGRFMAGLHHLHVVRSATRARAGIWYHVAATYHAGRWKLYVNGSLEAMHEGTLITRSSGGIAMGRKGESSPFPDFLSGSVDEAALFARALGPEEIAALHEAGSSGMCFGREFTRLEVDAASVRLAPGSADAFSVLASFTLDPDSDGLLLGSEDVEIGLGSYAELIPSSGLTCDAGRCEYRADAPGVVWLRLSAERVALRAEGVELADSKVPPTFSLTIGNDWGKAPVELEGHLGLGDGLLSR